jgi:regulatory protein
MTAPEGVRGETLAPVIYLPGVDRSAAQPPVLPDPATAPSVQQDDTAAQVLAEAAAASAHQVAVSALARRGLSRRELERVLRGRDFEESTIAEQLDRLEASGLIDDLALAQNLVGTLQERKGLGRSGIAAELTRRLLAPAAIEYALDLVDTGDELARARELARKRASQLRGYDHETAVRRLSGYLARRGYSGSVVRAAVEQELPRSGARSAARTGGASGVRFR